MTDESLPKVLERGKQPLGEKGIRKSLETVVKMAAEGQYDPAVRMWAINAQKAEGIQNDSSVPERANALLRSFRKILLWVDDPANAEWMQSANSTLHKFMGGDCDDLTIAYVSCLASLLSTSGFRAAVVGHGYDENRNIGHVLAAVWDPRSKEWFYADPSATEAEAPFGKFMIPPTRERVYDAITGEMMCDADACLFGSGSLKGVAPDPIRGAADRLVLSGIVREIPKAKELPMTNSRLSGVIDDAASLAAWTTMLSDELRQLNRAMSNAESQFDAMLGTAAEFGIDLKSLPGSSSSGLSLSKPGWGTSQQQAFDELMSMGNLARSFLTSCLSGERPLILDDKTGDWALKQLPTDTAKITERADGSLQTVGVVPSTTGIPPLLIGAIVAGGVAIYGFMFLIIRAAFNYATEVAQRVQEYMMHRQYVKCAEEQGVEACVKINEAVAKNHVRWVDAETEKKKEENNMGIFYVGGGIVLLLAAGYAYYKYEGKKGSRSNSSTKLSAT